MSDQAAEVKLGADTSTVDDKFAGTAASVEASLKRMADRLEQFGQQNKRNAEEVTKHNETLIQSFTKLKDQASGSFDKIGAAIERFRTLMLGVSGIVAGGALWKEVIDSTTHLQHEVSELQRVMGLTSTEATTLAIQLKLAGSNADSFSTIALHMGRMLKTNSDEFDRLGVKIKDSNGNLLPMQQIMRNVNERMAEFKLGTDQNMVALSLAGRSAHDFSETMQNLERVEGRAIEMQKQLGIEMGPERQEQVKAYKIEVNALGVVWDSIATRIGEKVLPKLQGFASWVNDYGPAIADVFVFMARSILTAFQVIGSAVGAYLTTFATIFRTLSINIAEDIERINKGLLSLKLSEVAAGYKSIWDKMKGETGAGVDSIVAQWQEMQKKLAALWSDAKLPSTKAGSGPRGGSANYTPPPGGAGGDTSQVPGFETELKRQRDAYERMKLEQGSFEQWSIQSTADYWKKILDLGGLSDKDRLSVLDRYYDAEREARLKAFAGEIATLDASAAKFKYNFAERIRIAQEAYAKIAAAFGPNDPRTQAAQRKVTEEENAAAEQKARLAEVEAKRIETAANHEVAMEQLATKQKLDMRQISAAQGFALEQQSENRLYEIKKTALDKLKALEAEGPNDPVKLAQIQNQIEELTQKHQEKLTEIQNAAVLERNKYALEASRRVEDAFAGFLASLGDSTKSLKEKFLDFGRSVEKIITEMIAKKLAAELLGAGTSGGDILGSLLGALFGGGSSVPSFATGTDYVPRTGLAMIHQGERIIPAAQNNGGSMGVTNNFTINGPVDGRTQGQIALAVQRGLARATYRDG